MNLLLSNRDYGPATDGWGAHTSSEGMELQCGLEHAGWTLAGVGYGDGCADVPTLLERHAPAAVFVQDPRDWDPGHMGSFRKDVGFTRVEALKEARGVFRLVVLKDAGSVRDYQRQFAQRMGADAVVVYYDPTSVRRLNPWLGRRLLIRTYHSVDTDLCRSLDLAGPRKRALVSGATSRAYPLRERVMHAALADRRLGIDVHGHPGYHNRGHHTPEYLRLLAGYRVHVATASRYSFALRKLFESVAVGTTPVTNLPAGDVLPEIDGALHRVPPNGGLADVLRAVDVAEREWDPVERLGWAEKAWAFYDWRAIGERLDRLIAEAAVARAVA